MSKRIALLSIVTIVLAATVPFTSSAQEPYKSHVATVLATLARGTWHFEGTSRHGGKAQQDSTFERGPGENSFVGSGTVKVDGSVTSRSAAVYTFHATRGRWIYTGVSSSGAVQEAEELESGENYFVFKGTAYRTDGGQTTFVWKVTLLEDNRFRSESMAYHGGSWKDNPSGEYTRK